MTPKALRAQVIADIIAASTAAGTNVGSAPISSIDPDNFPQIVVTVPSRNARQTNSTGTGRIDFISIRTVNVDIVTGVYGAYADDLDDLIEEVKAAVFGSATLIDALDDLPSYNVEVNFIREGEVPMAIATLTFDQQDWESY